MKKFRWKTIAILGLTFFLCSCASEKVQEEGNTDKIPETANVATDTPSAPGESVAPASPGVSPHSSAGASPAASETQTDYTVAEGDTLMKIAYRSCGDLFRWKEIYELNKEKIPDPNKIQKGIVIKVISSTPPEKTDPSAQEYEIKPGDTLGKISDSLYGTPSKWKDLYEQNKQLIHDPNRIFAGFTIYYSAPGTPLASTEPAQKDTNLGGNNLSLGNTAAGAPAAPSDAQADPQTDPQALKPLQPHSSIDPPVPTLEGAQASADASAAVPTPPSE